MARSIICIRPEPGLSATIRAGRERGIKITGIPLFRIEPVEWAAPDPDGFDGLLIGSANAIRHGGPQLASLLDLPVYAVGRTTAETAVKAGFQIAKVGVDGLQALLDQLPGEPHRLLRLCGEERVALSISGKRQIEEIVVYRSVPLDAPANIASLMGEEPIIMLHSAAAARHFAKQCNMLGLNSDDFRLAALGPRIADAAGEGWNSTSIASQPNDAALLALIENMCQ